MRSDGEIRQFESLQRAEHEDFKTQLTKEQAEQLLMLDPEHRHQERVRMQAALGAALGLAVSAESFEPPKREASGPTRQELAQRERRRKRNRAARKARKRNRCRA